MLLEIQKTLGHRLSRIDLAEFTLENEKVEADLHAAKWFREGRLDLVGETVEMMLLSLEICISSG